MSFPQTLPEVNLLVNDFLICKYLCKAWTDEVASSIDGCGVH